MDKRMAEWVLACLSSRKKASEIVGDLLEQVSGNAAFLWAVLRIAVAMAWIRAMGLAGAALSILCLLRAFIAIVPIPAGSRLITSASSVWDRAALLALLLSLSMWITAIMALTWLPSPRRKFMVALSLSILLTVMSWSYGAARVTPVLLVLLGCVCVGLLSMQEFRRSMLLAAAGAMSCAAIFMTAGLSVAGVERQFNAHIGHPDNLGLVRGGIFAAGLVLAPAACALVISWIDARTTPLQEAL